MAAADYEKHLLKQFVGGFETNDLCKTVRSLCHRGGITTDFREGNITILAVYSILNNK